ncbi:TPA: hypothetical protein ACPOYJ_001852 [Haemophilus influenzae]
MENANIKNENRINEMLSNIKNIIEETDKKILEINERKNKKAEEILKLRREVKKEENARFNYKIKRDNKIYFYVASLLISHLKNDTTEEEDLNLMNNLKNLISTYNFNVEETKTTKRNKKEVEKILNEDTEKSIFEDNEDEEEFNL